MLRRLPRKEVGHALGGRHKAAAATPRRLSLKLQQSKQLDTRSGVLLAVACPMHGKQLGAVHAA